MMEQIIDNSDLHFEHKLWEKEILFWLDEIHSFQNRLEEIQRKWTHPGVLVEMGQFQNQFILHQGKMEELKEEIERHEIRIAGQFMAREDAIDRVALKYHQEMRDRMETQRNLYTGLKKRFFSFLSKYM
ncbi:hypothetical protein IBL28_07280 [Sinomicrobium sp. FJxs]|uniref:Uncharacterized protein n=2 Tax=Sinomicrobium weinanense TaxID=2842200 RepID=A0A926Q392_9FLAO|nr:hypothetical protein [Sinomicrobium weinanense]MBU3121805.1 hypothetical protein [Sinomicrobium weinanense]